MTTSTIRYQIAFGWVKNEATVLRQQQIENGIGLLPISLPHILELDQLPHHHKDPFDRLIIAQARIEQATIITCDRAFKRYDCKTIW
ncbi:MAG: type II toxin-antitoxin system VapC family toxin [Phormidesmis sp.]